MANLEQEKRELDLKDNCIKCMPYEQIYKFLCEESQTNSVLGTNIQKQEKSFSSCIKYVYRSVMSLLNNKSGFLEDSIVYNLAVEYYITDIQEDVQDEKQDNIVNDIGTSSSLNKHTENVCAEQSLF